jgi:hypothetical protein
MIHFLLIAVLVVLVPATAALIHAVRHAADGYEDEFQFHPGVRPAPLAADSALAGSSLVPNWVEGPRSRRRPQLAPTDAAKA